jgi:wyosine [tRNA(Phe)-imidazoG37] synthetase (radical SAM superfamily)
VDRTGDALKESEVDLSILDQELHEIVEDFLTGALIQNQRFASLEDKTLLRLNDFAFSGDGEPTLSPQWEGAVKLVLDHVAHLKKNQISVKPILITNGTTLAAPRVQGPCKSIIEAGGELWVKCDVANAADFARVFESGLNFESVTETLIHFSQKYPVILQTLVFRFGDGSLSFNVEDYLALLKRFYEKGCKIQSIQLYTLARKPKDPELKPLLLQELQTIAQRVQEEIGFLTEVFGN